MGQRRSALVRHLESLGLTVSEGTRNGVLTVTCSGLDSLDHDQLDVVSELGHDRAVSWWLIDAATGRETICGARYSTRLTREWLREIAGR